MTDLVSLLNRSAARHNHLCPRQVLGVRMGLAVPSILGMDIPRSDKKLVVFLETDGCFADGIAVSTGCTVGHRTLRIEDYGKVAATFVQVDTGFAVRLSPRPDVREHSWGYAPNQKTHYYAQLYGYQVMPLKELFSIQEVTLTESIETILSHPGGRTNCDFCGEEIINERQLQIDGGIYCRACAGPVYYQTVTMGRPTPIHLELLVEEKAV